MKPKVDIIIQARMGSARLPGKVMKDLCGHPMIYHVIERCRRSALASNVIVVTSVLDQDDIIEDFCKQSKVDCFRGSEDDVLSRYCEAAKHFGSEIIARVTADCPLIDPNVIDMSIEEFLRAEKVDYISNTITRSFPRGLDVEVFSLNALKRANDNASEPYEREHVTPYIWENKLGEFQIGKSVAAPKEYRRDYRLTVDYPEDFALINEIYKALYKEKDIIDARDAISFLDANPKVANINADCVQKEIK